MLATDVPVECRPCKDRTPRGSDERREGARPPPRTPRGTPRARDANAGQGQIGCAMTRAAGATADAVERRPADRTGWFRNRGEHHPVSASFLVLRHAFSRPAKGVNPVDHDDRLAACKRGAPTVKAPTDTTAIKRRPMPNRSRRSQNRRQNRSRRRSRSPRRLPPPRATEREPEDAEPGWPAERRRTRRPRRRGHDAKRRSPAKPGSRGNPGSCSRLANPVRLALPAGPRRTRARKPRRRPDLRRAGGRRFVRTPHPAARMARAGGASEASPPRRARPWGALGQRRRFHRHGNRHRPGRGRRRRGARRRDRATQRDDALPMSTERSSASRRRRRGSRGSGGSKTGEGSTSTGRRRARQAGRLPEGRVEDRRSQGRAHQAEGQAQADDRRGAGRRRRSHPRHPLQPQPHRAVAKADAGASHSIVPPRITDKLMVITERGERDQIAVLEEDVLVQHYVTRTGRDVDGRQRLPRPRAERASRHGGGVRRHRSWPQRRALRGRGRTTGPRTSRGRAPRIEQVLKSGQAVMVQVTKDPMGGKGARLTAQISLPGRFLVFAPDQDLSGISRRLARRRAQAAEVDPEEGAARRARRDRAHGGRGRVRRGHRARPDAADRAVGRHPEAGEEGQGAGGACTRSPSSPCGCSATCSPTRSSRARHRFAARLREGDGRTCATSLPTSSPRSHCMQGQAARVRGAPHRGADPQGARPQGVAAQRRLPHHRAHRGHDDRRRQHRKVGGQDQPRGDGGQHEPRGRQGGRSTAPTARHRRHHRRRLHRHAAGEEQEAGRGHDEGGHGARQDRGPRCSRSARSA